MASRMFTGLGFNVKDDFKIFSTVTLDIKIQQLNFTEHGGRPAAETINFWMANNMNGKIHELISPGTVMRPTESNICTLNLKMAQVSFAESPTNQAQVACECNSFQGPLGATF